MIKPKKPKDHYRQTIIMGYSKTNSHSKYSSKQKTFIVSLLFLSLILIVLTASSFVDPNSTNFNSNTISFSTTRRLHKDDDDDGPTNNIPVAKQPQWLKTIIEEQLKVNKKYNPNGNDNNSTSVSIAPTIKVGLVNTDEYDGGLRGRHGTELVQGVEAVPIRFDSLAGSDLKWDDFFPEWIDEDGKWGPPTCPRVPLPSPGHDDLDAVVVRVPCSGDGVRDVFRLQVNLVAAHVAVRSLWRGNGGGGGGGGAHKAVHVVFLGTCGPMAEIFRCEDLVRHDKRGEFWVYRPEGRRLKQKILMPVGSCQLAPPLALSGREVWRSQPKPTADKNQSSTTTAAAAGHHRRPRPPRYAYVTILHSSEAYVCGAIALAHSIRLTNSTHDLVLLADTSSVGRRALSGLRSAGWIVLPVHRIRSPFSAPNSYNEYNYSKLRAFQLAKYDKIVFIDADLVVFRNLDALFHYPPLSAAPNDGARFNSGLMVLEPSHCLFEELMRRSFEVASYNGGDQGFLNEVFAWWHRLPAKTNCMKVFSAAAGSGPLEREIPGDAAAAHFLGLKPWVCYRDYDCNWDMEERHVFASDSAHRRWWEVYDAMPAESQRFCGLTKKMDLRIRKWRRIAEERNLSDAHWRIAPKDPRRLHFVHL